MTILGQFPTELKQRHQWVVWKYVTRDGKATKVPFMPGGNPASSTDSKTWCSFKPCVEAISRYEGLGFVFQEGGAYIGIDLDGCRDPATGKLELWAKEIVLKLNTYAEVSPSGSGVKMFGLSDARWLHRHNVKLPLPSIGGKDPGVEVYDSKRFFCVTGLQLSGMHELRQLDDDLDWLADKFSMRQAVATVHADGVRMESPVIERASKYLAKMEPSISGQDGHGKCFHAACVLVMGFCLSHDEALNLLTREYNPRCQPPWSEKELRHKVDQASKQPGSRGYLKDAQPEQWPKISTPSNYRDHKPVAVDDSQSTIRRTSLNQATRLYLSDLSSGKQMLIDTGIPRLDYAIGGGMALGEMVIVAARPSHGKSAIGLQMVHSLSAEGKPVVIVSEEMSARALGKRAIQYISDVPEEHWPTSIGEVVKHLDGHFNERAEVRIVESCGTVEAACSEIETATIEIGCKVAVVDYAQLLGSSGRDRYDKISRVSTALKKICGRLNIVLVVMAQLNREVESRNKFLPKMSDIKETGQFEQDADVIIFGVWPHKIDSAKDPWKYQLYVAKNRNRAINEHSFEIEFRPSRQKFVEQKPKSVYSNDFYPQSEWST